jgi:hypothetical protein
MLVCEDVTQTGAPAPRVSVQGIISTIRLRPGVGYPYRHPGLCVYVEFTGGVGAGRVRVTVADADDELPIFGTPEHHLAHPADRHAKGGAVFRISDCEFPRPGLYWVEFHYDDLVVQREPLVLR